ncbi:MAG: hypothetical protein ACREBE_03105, partial [bacterium]
CRCETRPGRRRAVSVAIMLPACVRAMATAVENDGAPVRCGLGGVATASGAAPSALPSAARCSWS